MSSIYLVRHGQAAFGQDDYDALSPLGERQGEELGRHWVRSGMRLDAVYVGPRRRHQQTAAALQAGTVAAGGELPPALPLPGFDEFPFQAILMAAAERMAEEMAELRARLGGADPLRERRSFDRLFMRAMTHWIGGELDGQVPELFAEFLARTRRGLAEVMVAQGRGKQVAVVTSAGPMAAAVQLGLGLPDSMLLKVCTVLANTALVELRYREAPTSAAQHAAPEVTVVSFNTTPHLSPDLMSYR